MEILRPIAVVVLTVLGLVALPSSGATQTSVSTSVFVFTAVAAPQSPTALETERLAIVDSLKTSLPDNKKISAQVTVTDVRENATITIEVTDASRQDRVMPRTRYEELVSPVYRSAATLSFGAYSTELIAMTTEASYKRTVNMGRLNSSPALDVAVGSLLRIKAATSLATKVHDWITINQDDLRKKP